MHYGFRGLEIYQLSFDLSVKIHHLTLKLPKYETYEEGSQLRRSSKSIPSNIAEGYGRKRYRNDFVKFIAYALSSCDETSVHLDILVNTNSISKEEHKYFINKYKELGIKINYFLRSITNNYLSRHSDKET